MAKQTKMLLALAVAVFVAGGSHARPYPDETPAGIRYRPVSLSVSANALRASRSFRAMNTLFIAVITLVGALNRDDKSQLSLLEDSPRLAPRKFTT